MNFARDPTAFDRTYRNSEMSLSVVFAARVEVEGFGGREARKSPYAGPSWSLRSNILSATEEFRAYERAYHR
jgi:hypothetical protein